MESSRSPSEGALEAEAGLLAVPAIVSSMTEADYTQLVTALSTAASLLASRRGGLSAADLRIRSLVSLAEKEANRTLLEARSRRRAVEAQGQASVAT